MLSRVLQLSVIAFAPRVALAENQHGLGCTAIAVDGEASKDGSALAGMNADCSSCDGRMAWIPPADHSEGSTRPLYIFSGNAPRFVGHGRGAFYEPKEGEELSEKTGELPQVNHTYGYWEATLPLMNEVGLAFGESSCAAKLLNYPLGQAPSTGDPRTGEPAMEGKLDLTNMMQIALERCATARCAVKLMGALAEEHGFFPMVGEWSVNFEGDTGKMAFDDGGEALSIADRTGEAWIFHVLGGVRGITKSVWAAQRLPKGHAAFIANNFILREVPVEPNEDWLFSSKLREVAVAADLWNGKEPLDFARVFAPDTVYLLSAGGVAPIPLYASLRLFGLFNIAAPNASKNLKMPLDPLVLPPTVAVETPLEGADMFKFLSTAYEGTEFDLSLGVLAGPFGNPFPVEGGAATSKVGQIPRGVSIARTVYSFIGQSRLEGHEPVAWIAPDTPMTSVYVPFYPSAGSRAAPAFSIGTMGEFTRDSAWWAFDFVANWASHFHWRESSAKFVLPLRAELQKEILDEMVGIEYGAKGAAHGGPGLAGTVLGERQTRLQQRVVDRWWKLADEIVVAYNDDFFNDAKTKKFGQHLGYPEWWARAVGFNQDVHPLYVKRDDEASERYSEDAALRPPRFHAFESPAPQTYDTVENTWVYAEPAAAAGTLAAAAEGAAPVSSSFAFASFQAAVTVAALVAGIAIGRAVEKRKQSPEGAYLLLA